MTAGSALTLVAVCIAVTGVIGLTRVALGRQAIRMALAHDDERMVDPTTPPARPTPRSTP